MVAAAPEYSRPVEPSTVLGTVDCLLRDPAALVARIREGKDLADLARAMIITVATCSAIYGAALGTFRGGPQIAYAGLKLPVAILATACVCAPGLTAWNAAFGRAASLSRDLALVLASLGLGTLVLAAQAPVMLLLATMGAGYHTMVLVTVGTCGLAGAVGVSLLLRGLSKEPARALVGTVLLATFAIVGTQVCWTLRPFLVRPRAQSVPVVRAIEGSFIDAVVTSQRSARGVYWRDSAPLPEEAE